MIVPFSHLSDFHLKGKGNPVDEFNQDHATRSLAEKVESLVEEGETFGFTMVFVIDRKSVPNLKVAVYATTCLCMASNRCEMGLPVWKPVDHCTRPSC